MVNGVTLLAVIPARSGSKGLPQKNILDCAGRPLIGWTIAAARGVDALDAVVVSTDSEEIASVAREFGAAVPFLRPEALATDAASVLDAISHMWQHSRTRSGHPFDYVMILQPTSPLRTEDHITDAVSFYFENRRSDRDTLASVVDVGEKFGWLMERSGDGPHIRFCFEVSSNPQRQLLHPYFLPNGAIYIVKGDALASGIYGDRTLPFVMRAEDSIDVDSIDDLGRADAALRQRGSPSVER